MIDSRHYRISVGVFWTTISFLDTSQQSSSFFNLVEVTLNGLLIAQFSFPAKICLALSATRKQSLQNFLDQSLYLDSGLITCADHVRRSHHSMTSIVRLYSNHTPLDQSKREFYAVHCIKFDRQLYKL